MGIIIAVSLAATGTGPSLSESLLKASQSDKGLLLYFTNDACHDCDPWESFLERQDVKEAIGTEYIIVKVNTDDFDGKACSDIYHVDTPPAIVIVDKDGEILYRDEKSLRELALIQFLQDPKNTVQAKRIESDATPQHFSPTPDSPDSGKFWVQTGYFGNRANAERMASELEQAGFSPVHLMPEEKEGRTFTRVLIGSYSTEDQARQVIGQCERKGISAKLYF
jgi:hypothetical protein